VWLLALVAAAPGILRIVPTASLAAVLVYTGYKLVNPANIRRLIRYGGMPVAIYATSVVMIVATDLPTGIIAGLTVSLASVIYALTHLSVQVKHDKAGRRFDVYLRGAATFIRMPKLVDALERLPSDAAVHLHIQELGYIDHARIEAICSWEKQRRERSGKIVVEWDELMAKYRTPDATKSDQTAHDDLLFLSCGE